ncbi:UNVERIFIED_CONTAM: hypothetical protein K2H54_000983 [Gekko kuhli]
MIFSHIPLCPSASVLVELPSNECWAQRCIHTKRCLAPRAFLESYPSTALAGFPIRLAGHNQELFYCLNRKQQATESARLSCTDRNLLVCTNYGLWDDVFPPKHLETKVI